MWDVATSTLKGELKRLDDKPLVTFSGLDPDKVFHDVRRNQLRSSGQS